MPIYSGAATWAIGKVFIHHFALGGTFLNFDPQKQTNHLKSMLLGVFYIFLCFVVGMLGRRTYLGFWMNFIFSLFFTPIFPLIYILIASDKGAAREKYSSR